MRIKQIILKQFKTFDDLTIDLGQCPKKSCGCCRTKWLSQKFNI